MNGLSLAFCVFKVFRYGGIPRDLLRIADGCVERGHTVRIYTLRWDVAELPQFEVVLVPVKSSTNHRLYARFADWVRDHLAAHPVDCVIGMNKMPGLDVYYAGDSCYEDKARTQRSFAYRLTARYRLFSRFERAVFDRDSRTEILTISEVQTPLFRKHYGTQYERLHALPPGIDPSRRAPPDRDRIRAEVRRDFGLDDDVKLLLFVGSGFIKKGLDRAIEAFAALPPHLRERSRFYVIGEDNARPFEARIRKLGLERSIRIFPGRDDVPRFLFAADALVLPAYDENAGMVIIEGMIAGLPVLVTENCGYAHWVERAQAGLVVRTPYSQGELNGKLVEILTSPLRERWRANGLALGDCQEIYELVPRVVTFIEDVATGRYRPSPPAPEIAFVLFKYFPYGGLQRNFLRTAEALKARGFRIRTYTLSWEGQMPERMDVVILPAPALTNHRRYARFERALARALAAQPVRLVVGFNKMRDLDLYYAADPCFEEKARSRGGWYRRTPRYRYFAAAERAVFERGAATRILLIAPGQQADFERHYGTEPERFRLLPPGIARDRMAGDDARAQRVAVRNELGLADDSLLLLLVGSGFVTKGLDRALIALSQLPADLAARTQLLAIGQDNPRAFLRMAERLGVADRFRVLAGRDDVPRFLQGADVLVHPAYAETAGNVLLEAAVAGLPSIVTDVCGNAPYVRAAAAGRVVASPFEQEAFNAALVALLYDSGERARLRANGIAFGRTADIYSLPDVAADYIARIAREHPRRSPAHGATAGEGHTVSA